MAIGMSASFIVVPFLIARLGEANYGLWILIASLNGYFTLLDLGVRGSVGRHIAYHRAKGDHRSVNTSLSTAVAYLLGAAGAALVLTVVTMLVLFPLLRIPLGQTTGARMALLIVGINLAASLPLSAFDATLWAFQRFDVLNAIDIPATLLRVGLTFGLITGQNDLVTLALITLLTILLAGAAKAAASFRLDPNLSLGPALVEREAAGQLFGYGRWVFLLSVGRMINAQVSPLVIGAQLGVAMVTPYSIAIRLIGLASSLIVAGTGVLTPVATALHAEENTHGQRTLLLEGGRYCLALALFFVLFFALLGGPLVRLWVGDMAGPSTRLLAILAIGELLPMSQSVSSGVILGMGRHRELSWLSILENVLAVALGVAVARPFGLIGVAIVFAVTGAICRGLAQLVYACRVVNLPVFEYLWRSVLPVTSAAVVPAMMLWGMNRFLAPRTWIPFLACLATYSACWTVAGVLLAWPRIARLIAETVDGGQRT
jgi:O-antigen/teichoic acid export membrane protein